MGREQYRTVNENLSHHEAPDAAEPQPKSTFAPRRTRRTGKALEKRSPFNMIFSSFVIFVTFVVNGLFLFWLRPSRAKVSAVNTPSRQTHKSPH